MNDNVEDLVFDDLEKWKSDIEPALVDPADVIDFGPIEVYDIIEFDDSKSQIYFLYEGHEYVLEI